MRFLGDRERVGLDRGPSSPVFEPPSALRPKITASDGLIQAQATDKICSRGMIVPVFRCDGLALRPALGSARHAGGPHPLFSFASQVPRGDVAGVVSGLYALPPTAYPVRKRGRLAVVAGLAGLAAVAGAQEQKKQPPPQFTTGYRSPTPQTPGPRADVFSTVDVVVLAVVLALTAYFSLVKRSRGEIRMLVTFSVIYFGFYRLGCVCAVGSLQNVALSLGPNGYGLPFMVGAFFLLPIVAALFFGRIFCAAACPLGALQDLLTIKPVKVPVWLEHALGLIPYVYLGFGVLFAATGSAFLICQYDPFVGFFRMSMSATMLWIGVALLVVGIFVGRPYCRFACPYRVLLGLCSRVAWRHATITPDQCVVCSLCEGECPFGAIRKPTPESVAGEE